MVSPQPDTHKFNIDRTTREKPSPTGIGGVPNDCNSKTFIVFSKSIGQRDSNEAKLISIRKALSIWYSLGGEKLIIEGDFYKAIGWAKGLKKPP